MRSETRAWRKLMPKGVTQKWSVSSGSRAVMCPATPSEKPKRPNSRSAPASFCLRCRRSSSSVANFGGAGMASMRLPSVGAPAAAGAVSERACSMASNYRLRMAYPTAASLDIAAPAERIWALVADLPRMGEWSPENAGGKWVKGATGPALGAVFKGTNKNGVRRWSTTVTVIVCEPNKVFEFAVTSGPLAVANWRYEFEETDAGCRGNESWAGHRKP